MLGQNLLPSDNKSDSSNDDDGDDSIWDKVKDKVHDIGDDAKGKINDLAGDIIGDIAGEIGVSDWYSLHIMNACQGNFGANATATHFQLNVTNCTQSSPGSTFETLIIPLLMSDNLANPNCHRPIQPHRDVGPATLPRAL